MTDTIDFAASYSLYQQNLHKVNLLNKETVFTALANAGISSVIVDFDGEGDSGQINNIAANARGEPRDIPDVTIEVQRASWGADEVGTAQTTLEDAIESLCYDALSEEHGGWENNDGAFGEFTFSVEERTLNLEVNARFSDFVTSHHTF